MKTLLILSLLTSSVLSPLVARASCIHSDTSSGEEAGFQRAQIARVLSQLAALQNQINNQQNGLSSANANLADRKTKADAAAVFIGKLQMLAQGLDSLSLELQGTEVDRDEIARHGAETDPDTFQARLAGWKISEMTRLEISNIFLAYSDLEKDHPKVAIDSFRQFTKALASVDAASLLQSLAVVRDALTDVQKGSVAEVAKLNAEIRALQASVNQTTLDLAQVQQASENLVNELHVRTQKMNAAEDAFRSSPCAETRPCLGHGMTCF